MKIRRKFCSEVRQCENRLLFPWIWVDGIYRPISVFAFQATTDKLSQCNPKWNSTITISISMCVAPSKRNIRRDIESFHIIDAPGFFSRGTLPWESFHVLTLRVGRVEQILDADKIWTQSKLQKMPKLKQFLSIWIHLW